MTRDLTGHTFKVQSVAFSRTGHLIASASSDQTVRIWHAKTGACVDVYRHPCAVSAVAFSPDGKTLASGTTFVGSVRLWSIKTSLCIGEFQGHVGCIYSVVFSPNGKTLASASSDFTVRHWSVNSGQCLAVLSGHTDWVWVVTFSADGKHLASASQDHTVRVWHVETGKCESVFRHDSWAIGMALASSGIIFNSDHKWQHWNDDMWRRLQSHATAIFAVAMSSNGNMLASGSADNTLRLWNVETGECTRSIPLYGAHRLVFSRNNKTLACVYHRLIRLESLLDYDVLCRVALFLRVGIAPYVALDIADHLLASGDRSLASKSPHMHYEKISFISQRARLQSSAKTRHHRRQKSPLAAQSNAL